MLGGPHRNMIRWYLSQGTILNHILHRVLCKHSSASIFYDPQNIFLSTPKPRLQGSRVVWHRFFTTTRHEFFLGVWILGPLHTRAKSRDHEIVRAQKKVSKGHRPKRPPQPCSVVTLKCSVKSYVPGPSTKCYFNELLFMQAVTHDNI